VYGGTQIGFFSVLKICLNPIFLRNNPRAALDIVIFLKNPINNVIGEHLTKKKINTIYKDLCKHFETVRSSFGSVLSYVVREKTLLSKV
jgi:hypothetical protein